MLDQYGVDAMRYVLLRDGVLDTDSSFSGDLVATISNTVLADSIGNLLSRTTAPTFLSDGRLPTLHAHKLSDTDRKLIQHVETAASTSLVFFDGVCN